MAYPTVGSEGRVTSWGAAGSLYETLLSNFRPMSAVVNIASNEEEFTGLNATTQAILPGIRSVTATLRGYALATPAFGNAGFIDISGTSHYDARPRSWELLWETAAVHDITELTGSALTWRQFRPDYTRVSGSMTFDVDSATALTPGLAPGDSIPTLTLKYTSTAQLSGGAVLTSISPSVVRGQKNLLTYNFRGNGNWAASGTGSIFGALTFGQIPWSDSGTLNPLVIATLAGVKTMTLADSFIRSLRISLTDPGQPVMVECQVQASGAVTMA